MGKWIDYVTRGPEYKNTYKRSGTQTQEAKAVRCASCGQFVSAADTVCPGCGADLTSEEQLAQNAKAKSSNKLVIAVIVIIGALVCAAAVYLRLTTPGIIP